MLSNWRLHALNAIQNQNWQCLIKSILNTCISNNGAEAVDIKKLKLVENSVENITICNKAYRRFYEQIAQNLINTFRMLSADETEETNKICKEKTIG